MWQAIVTIAMYIPLLTLTYGYDKLREKRALGKLGVTHSVGDEVEENAGIPLEGDAKAIEQQNILKRE